MRLNGKIAIVTGGGRGIGRAISKRLAKEGVIVAVVDLNFDNAQKVQQEIIDSGYNAFAFKVDITNSEQINQMVKKIKEEYGRIDILVNNAGVMQGGKVEEIEEEDWDKMLAVNLKGTFLCSKAVIKEMKRRKSGKIINISSLAGKTGGIMVGAHYAASKGGIIAFSKALARELTPFHINVNTVAPGTTNTELIQNFSLEERKKLKKSIPLGRLGMPEDVANAVFFLVSEEANFITGTTLDVNGGLLMD